MKHVFLVFLITLGSLSHLWAQDFLVFPRKDVQTLSNLPLEACVRDASALVHNLDTKDISKADELSRYGRQLLQLGQHEYAKETFEKALELNNAAYGKKDIRYIKALVDLARAYILLIRYTEAAGMFKEALTTLKATLGTQSKEYLTTLNENALVYARSSDWYKSVQMSKEGIQLLEKRGDKSSIYYAIFLNNLGAALKNTYNYKQAIKYYEQSFKLISNHPRLSISVAANLAEAYALTNHPEKAHQLLKTYRPRAKKILANKDLTFARVWMQYGVAYTVLNDYDNAKACFQEALVTNSLTYTNIHSIPEQADDLMFKNNFLATCGQAGIFMHSVEMYKRIYEQTGDINALKDGYKVVQALAKYGEKLMNSYLSEANKLILFRLGADILFDRSIYYAYELYQHTQESQYIEDAFFYAERSKSTLLVNALRAKENKNLVDLPQNLVEQEKAYKANLKALQKQQIEAVEETEKNNILQQINDLNITIESFKADLKRRYPSYYEHRYNIDLCNLKAVQEMLAVSDKALIEYTLGIENHYAFLVLPDQIKMIQLDIKLDNVEKHTKNLRKALTNYKFMVNSPDDSDSLFTASSRYFYQTFIEPFAQNISLGQHLLIIPDQSLGHLPFETFLTSIPTQAQDFANYPYLIKDYPISYGYSATTLLSHKKRTREVPKRGVLAFAAEYPTITSNSYSHQRGGNLGLVREGLQPLPGAQKEVALMQKYLLGEFYNGMTASEATFKKTAHNYGVIHLAMHGVLDSKNPILSSLVFSEDSSEVEDNFLRAYEIAQLDLNADLVVLSACETGYGKFQQGEGVMSLAYSFAYAGASSVLMSLWKVNDFSTSQIMKHFYINMAKGWTKDKALREAKLEYLKDKENQAAMHPAFWAAFIQMGDVAPVTLLDKCGNTFPEAAFMFVGGAIIGILLLLFLFFRWKKNKAA